MGVFNATILLIIKKCTVDFWISKVACIHRKYFTSAKEKIWFLFRHNASLKIVEIFKHKWTECFLQVLK